MKKPDNLYRTDKEERTYRELKQKYGIKDAVVVKGNPDDEDDGGRRRRFPHQPRRTTIYVPPKRTCEQDALMASGRPRSIPQSIFVIVKKLRSVGLGCQGIALYLERYGVSTTRGSVFRLVKSLPPYRNALEELEERSSRI